MKVRSTNTRLSKKLVCFGSFAFFLWRQNRPSIFNQPRGLKAQEISKMELATEKQVDYIKALLKRLKKETAIDTNILQKSEASNMIDELLSELSEQTLEAADV